MADLRTDTHRRDKRGVELGPPPEDTSRASWRAFLVGLVIVALFVGGVMAVIRFVVLPQQDAQGEAQFVRAQATISALQTQEALTPKPTSIPTLAPQVLPTSGPATKETPGSGAAPGTAPGAVPPVTAPIAPGVAATSVAGATPASQPDVATAAPQATSATTPAPAVATTVPAQVATGQPAPTAPPAANGSTDDERIPLAVQGDIDPALVAELEHAYWLYWQARAQANATLDVTPMRQVGDETEVNGTATLIEQLRAEGHSVRVDVQHHAELLSATDQEAVIFDEREDHSYYVNLATGQPEEPRPPAQTYKLLYRFNKVDGMWKVTGNQPA